MSDRDHAKTGREADELDREAALDPATREALDDVRDSRRAGRSIGQARMESQERQSCGACEAGIEHTREECEARTGEQ